MLHNVLKLLFPAVCSVICQWRWKDITQDAAEESSEAIFLYVIRQAYTCMCVERK